ncbi:MAG: hypothetical protein H9535_19825 [Ignavibacteria bacterium]|nr:hypothetical protein [Ignavibacteria bacterium]
MGATLALFNIEEQAKNRLDERLHGFRTKYAPQKQQPNATIEIETPLPSVSPIPETLTKEPETLVEEPVQAAKQCSQPEMEVPSERISEEVFWACVFGVDEVLHISELTRRTRYCGEIFGIIKKPLPQYLNDATQDTLAHNLINRAHYDGLLQETARFSNHAVLWSHNYCYQHGTTTQN